MDYFEVTLLSFGAIFLLYLCCKVVLECYKFHKSNNINNPNIKSSSTPSTESHCILHRYEWIVGVFVLCWLLYMRTVHYSQGSWFGTEEWEQNVFEMDWSTYDVSRKLYTYCGVDIEILCANQGEYYHMDGDCEAVYGPFLTRKLHITHTLQNDPVLTKWTKDKIIGEDYGEERSSSSTSSSVPLDDMNKCALAMQMQVNGWNYLVQHGYPDVTASQLQPYIQNKTLIQENRDAVVVAKAIIMVLSTTMPTQYFTCSHRTDGRTRNHNNYAYLHTTEEDQEVLYRFYLHELLDMFATDKAVEGRLVTRSWSVTEFLDIVSAASKLLPYQDRHVMLSVHQEIAKIMEEQDIQDKEAATRYRRLYSSLSSSHTVSAVPVASVTATAGHPISSVSYNSGGNYYQDYYEHVGKHDFHLFPCNNVVDQCMYSHYENQTLVTDICPLRMKQAQAKMKELQFCPVSNEFVFYIHFCFLMINVIWLLMLVRSCSIRNKYKQRLDKKRRQLEQELNDPFLRESLERKAQQLPEAERARFFSGLEDRIRHWDSSAGATKHTKRWIRRFRLLILFAIALNLCFGCLLIKWQVESRAQFLESIFVGVLLWTLSYAIKIPEITKTTSISSEVIGNGATEALVSAVEEGHIELEEQQ